jgi:hypothetical protein
MSLAKIAIFTTLAICFTMLLNSFYSVTPLVVFTPVGVGASSA